MMRVMEKQHVLVTGAHGAFVRRLIAYISRQRPNMLAEGISLRGDEWRSLDFSRFDAVIHAAGIVASDSEEELERVNVALTRDVAKKAFDAGVNNFVFLSSMAVYDGIGWGFGRQGLITEDTVPVQSSVYGASKYRAELEIGKLQSASTKVAIVRAPSIVGDGMENYFNRYIKFAKLPVIPIPWVHPEAKRSFIYVDTLAAFICNLIENEKEGVFYPQQFPQLSVSEMMQEVCNAMRKSKKTVEYFNAFIPNFIQRRFFSQICYDVRLSYEENMRVSTITAQDAVHRSCMQMRKS